MAENTPVHRGTLQARTVDSAAAALLLTAAIVRYLPDPADHWRILGYLTFGVACGLLAVGGHPDDTPTPRTVAHVRRIRRRAWRLMRYLMPLLALVDVIGAVIRFTTGGDTTPFVVAGAILVGYFAGWGLPTMWGRWFVARPQPAARE